MRLGSIQYTCTKLKKEKENLLVKYTGTENEGKKCQTTYGVYLYIITEGLTKLLTNIFVSICPPFTRRKKKTPRHTKFFWLTNYCIILVSYSHTQKKSATHRKKGICLRFCLPSVCVTIVLHCLLH